VEAVLASVALPGILPPVRWAGELLGDGGVSNNTPLSHAVQLGAREVYVLPAGGACERLGLPGSALGMLMHAVALMQLRHLMAEVRRLRGDVRLVVVPPPCPQSVLPSDFRHADRLIQAGEESTHHHLDAVEAGLAEPAALFGPPEDDNTRWPVIQAPSAPPHGR